MRNLFPIIGSCLLFAGGITPTLANSLPEITNKHAPYGQPTCKPKNLKKRIAYTICFDSKKRIPKWVMYHVTSEYLKTPKRKSRFKRFRDDPHFNNEAKDKEYTNSGYARGHLVPFKVSGGDRDGDKSVASLGNNSDPDDEKTVFEVNYMSNIAPQCHKGFNGGGGSWWKVERWIQSAMVKKKDEEAYVIAGTIFHDGKVKKIGPKKDIYVPHAFYKIVVFKAKDNKPRRVFAFLFPHDFPCKKRKVKIENFLVSVDIIEALTGLDFFSEANFDEAKNTTTNWGK